jgi:exodeoxyribonuclease-5
MVCNKPITDSKNKVLLNNNDEFIVETFGLKKESLNPKISYYSVKINSNGKTHIIKILSENSESEYKKELDALKNKAINSTGLHKRNAWVKYYKFMEKYADVKYNYALTVHKAQGSTFDNAIVINCDISRIKDVVDKNKLLYTAITRAKNKLFIV